MNDSALTIAQLLQITSTEKLHGKCFSAIRNGHLISGLISFNPEEPRKIYLCSDDRNLDGSLIEYKFGFKYSWVIDIDWSLNNAGNDLDSLVILQTVPDIFKENLETPVPIYIQLNDGYKAEIHKGFIKVGCQEISNDKIKELYNFLKY